MDFVPIVKPVGGDCNLDCTYCYFLQKLVGIQRGVIMPAVILQELINQTCAVQKKVEFIWHGGEPMLAGMKFYKQALKFQMPWIDKGAEIYNSIQTNGTLLTDEWLRFLQDNHFSIGISIDGPEELHNQLRKDKHGRGTFRQVEQSIKLSQQAQILSGIICCVSKTTCPHPQDIFEFFVELGTKDIKFLQVQGRDDRGQPLSDSVSPLDFANFLLEVMRLWLELDDPSVTVVEIDSVIKAILGQEVRDCMFMGECHRYFTVYPDGQVYGCDSLPKAEQFSFGYIGDGVEQLLGSTRFQCFRSRMAQIQNRCHKCRWFRICHGGCLQDYYPDIFNAKTRNLFCPGLKRIYKKITHLLNEYKLLTN